MAERAAHKDFSTLFGSLRCRAARISVRCTLNPKPLNPETPKPLNPFQTLNPIKKAAPEILNTLNYRRTPSSPLGPENLKPCTLIKPHRNPYNSLPKTQGETLFGPWPNIVKLSIQKGWKATFNPDQTGTKQNKKKKTLTNPIQALLEPW